MTAVAAPGRVTPEYEPNSIVRTYPVDALAVILNGTIVALDSTGYAVPGISGTGLITVGIAQESVTGGAADGDVNVTVHIGVFRLLADSTFAQTAVGSLCYIVDNQTVSLTSTSRSIAGTVAAVDGGNVWVAMGLESAIDNTTLTAYEASLAATTVGAGSDLVGIYDPASIITATTVGAALQEMEKQIYPQGTAPQALSGVGACNVTSLCTNYTSTGASQALSLANGTYTGQLKVVHHTVDGGSGILTPTTAGNFANFTLTAIHDACLLQWSGTAWNILLNVGGTVG